MKKILASFLIAITLFCNLPINVYASELGGGGYAHKWVGWSDEEKKSFCRDKLTGAILQRVGVVIQPDKWTSEAWTNAWNKHLGEIEIASGMTYDEYIMSLVSVDEDNEEFVISDSLLDSFHSVANIYIEEETGYYVIPTLSAKDLLAENFYNKATMDAFKNYINNLGTDICIVGGYYNKYGSSYGNLYQIVNGEENMSSIGAYTFYRLRHDYGIVSSMPKYNNNIPYLHNYSVYTFDWIMFPSNSDYIADGLTMNKEEPFLTTKYRYNAEENDYYVFVNPSDNPFYGGIYTYFTVQAKGNGIYTADGRSIRIYKTLEDFKNYSVGTRPYYITDAFNNYDSTVDNSTTITQTEIDNSVTYGDVYNYITNNYDNPDGLSEDELRAILAEYLSQINNNNSGGGSGGSDNGSGSGGGLGGFLDGLGSVGNAIMSILGKLMEILGSAIELVTGAITDLITIIPNSIGELLGALFPVFPEEWIKAITLSLVLGVVVGIVRMFK